MNPALGNYPQLQLAIRRATNVYDALVQAGQHGPAARLRDAIQAATQMRMKIGVVGRAKVGKSTFINAVLGRQDDLYAPVDEHPATNIITCFAHGSDETVRVICHSDDPNAPGLRITPQEIRLYACEKDNPGNRKNVKALEVIAPFPRLGADVVLVDTPGADNALTTMHDTVLLECLPAMDAIIFLVRSDDPITKAAITLLSHVTQADVKKLFFGVTMIDRADAEELAQGLDGNRRTLNELGLGNAELYPLCAPAFQQQGSEPGMQRLLDAVHSLINDGRVAAIVERLDAIATRSAADAQQRLGAELALARRSEAENIADKAETERLLIKLRKERPELELRFKKRWKRSFHNLENALPSISAALKREFERTINDTSDGQLSTLGHTIHTHVLKRLDDLLTPHTTEFNAEVQLAMRDIEVDFRSNIAFAPRESAALLSVKSTLATAGDAAMASAPSVLGAIGLASLPGIISTAMLTFAPSFWLFNPATWLPAIAASATAAFTTAVLTPLATVGTPLLLGYAGYRCFSTWKGRMGQTRADLILDVRQLIEDALAETAKNIGKLRDSDEDIIREFLADAEGRLEAWQQKIDSLLATRPSPELLAGLEDSLLMLERAATPLALPAAATSATSAATGIAPH